MEVGIRRASNIVTMSHLSEVLDGTELIAYEITEEDLDNIKAGRKIWIAIAKDTKVIVMSQHPLKKGVFKPLQQV
jgi:hypothetical protein